VDNNWLREAELNGQACAIDPMRFDCGMAAGFSMKIPTIMATVTCSCSSCDKRDKEFYSRPLSFMNGGD